MELSEIHILKIPCLKGVVPARALKVIKMLDDYNSYDDNTIIKAFTQLSKTSQSPFSLTDLEEVKQMSEND